MFERRCRAVCRLVWAVLAVIVLRLVWLALIRGEELRSRAEAQWQRSFPYYQYSRGDIVDRSGLPMVNIPEYCLLAVPSMLAGDEGLSEQAAQLAEVLGIDEQRLLQRLQRGRDCSAEPWLLKSGLSIAQVNAVRQAAVPGILCLTLPVRYGAEQSASALIGYVQQDENGTYHGVCGLEEQYDGLLSQRPSQQVTVDVDGYGVLSGTGLRLEQSAAAPVPTVHLTIDRNYQLLAEQVFAELGYQGCCVVLEPQSCDVLALVTAPGFDPYGWEDAADGAYLQRALCLYPPASTFKTVVALAALEQQRADCPAESDILSALSVYAEDDGFFVCTGSYSMAGGHTVHCEKEGGHGAVSLTQALACSCNCCFVALAERLGGEVLAQWARRLHLTETELLGLSCGTDGEDEYLDFSPLSEADVANVCLGEQGIRINAVQEAALFAACANNGVYRTPRLVSALDAADGSCRLLPADKGEQLFSPESAAVLQKMLRQTVDNGTGQGAALNGVGAAGKTGSSETGTVWFSGYAPAEQPRLVISVCVNDGVAGGVEAAAVFRAVTQAIFELEQWL